VETYRRLRLSAVADGVLFPVIQDGPRVGYCWLVERMALWSSTGPNQVLVFVAPQSAIDASHLDYSYLVDEATFDSYDVGDNSFPIFVPQSEVISFVFVGGSVVAGDRLTVTLQVKQYGP
jgi:hypothetical protein